MKSAVFEKWKDAYKGKRCFIIGNGPSLRLEDLERLHENKEICFASNRIYLSFPHVKWRPDFYTLQDGEMIQQYRNELIDLDVKNKWLSDYSLIKLNDKRIKGAEYFHLDTKRYYPYYPDFSQDVNECIFEGFTVTYANMQFAAYMGFSEMYLLGVDFSYGAAGTDYFITGYVDPTKARNIPMLDRSFQAYCKAEGYSYLHGFRVFNATRGGKLEVFERVDFDNLLK